MVTAATKNITLPDHKMTYDEVRDHTEKRY